LSFIAPSIVNTKKCFKKIIPRVLAAESESAIKNWGCHLKNQSYPPFPPHGGTEEYKFCLCLNNTTLILNIFSKSAYFSRYWDVSS